MNSPNSPLIQLSDSRSSQQLKDSTGDLSENSPNTSPLAHDRESIDWRSDGLRYFSYSYYLKKLYGHRVQRVSVDAGFTCPNVDGTVAVGGCTFCDNRSFSPSRRLPRQDILDQIEHGIGRLKKRYKCKHFMAYFQPATNTYAPVEVLRPLYERAISHPEVIALAIGTRQDCVPDDVLDLLEEIGQQVPLTVEYGLQTIHDKTMDWMNRGHFYDSFVDAMQRSIGRGFEICAHIMLGLPGESPDDMLATAREVAVAGLDAVKIHNLYAVENTAMAAQVRSGEVKLMEFEDYITTVVDFMELLPSSMVIERISGEAPGDYFIGPQWCLDKPAVLKGIDEEFKRRDSWQGKKFTASL